MIITLVSIPASVIQASPEILSYWLATESPNNFRLQRKDFAINSTAQNSGSPASGCKFTLSEAFTGNEGDLISVYNAYNGAMYSGTVTDVSGSDIETTIPYDANFDGEYLNDHTLFNGFYFEGQLTVNDVVQPLTVIASPDTFGIADLDVSGILRISTSLTKVGDYSSLLMAETNKSGKFTFAYRPSWYGSSESYTEEGNTWYYAEVVRSVEQGSNLADYVSSAAGDAPFLNSFTQPVYFVGLPLDLSFICPDNVAGDLRVTVSRYDASNNLINETVSDLSPTGLEGRVVSLLIDPDVIESTAAYITAKIEVV